jgi:hypothetical protein
MTSYKNKRPDGKPASGNRNPPYRVKRVHGPAATFAGYKTRAMFSLALFLPFFFSNNPNNPLSRDTWCLLFIRIRLFCLDPTISYQALLIGYAGTKKTAPARYGVVSTRIRDRSL